MSKEDLIFKELGIIAERTNHLTDDMIDIKKRLINIELDVSYVKEEISKPLLGLNKKQIAGILLAIPTLVTLLQVLMKAGGFL